MKKILFTILTLLALSISAPPLLAASVQPLSLEQIVDYSDEIVIGKVISSEARWQGKLIVTVSQVEVRESLKGAAAQTIEITRLGGSAVHPTSGIAVTMDASTFVELQPGEEILLFVSRDANGVGQLVGAEQGRMRIRTDPKSGLRELPMAPKRLDVLRGQDQDTIRSGLMTLDEMRRRIQRRLRPGQR